MTAYYNENDPKAAAWLRELIKKGHIAHGEVDQRSIEDVAPVDLVGFTQCHFFAGIGGWSYALRLAGWPDDRPVWTGSCPCQPLSSAARGRHVVTDLWGTWRTLIAASAPGVVFGEQVVSAKWADKTVMDLEALGYEVGAAVLPAFPFGADHKRERFYFAGYADSYGEPGGSVDEEAPRLPVNRSVAHGVAAKDGVSGRVGLLRGYGNAIVPQVAATFIEAVM